MRERMVTDAKTFGRCPCMQGLYKNSVYLQQEAIAQFSIIARATESCQIYPEAHFEHVTRHRPSTIKGLQIHV